MVSMLLLMLQTPMSGAVVDPVALIATARSLTSASPRCVRHEAGDVLVCGLREADRYRVPLLVVAPGDPAHEGVHAERERLLHRTTPMQDMGPFLVGGGMVGVTYSTKGGLGTVQQRPIAP